MASLESVNLIENSLKMGSFSLMDNKYKVPEVILPSIDNLLTDKHDLSYNTFSLDMIIKDILKTLPNKEDITKLCLILGKHNCFNIIDNVLKNKNATDNLASKAINNVTKDSMLIISNYCFNDEEALLKSLNGDIEISKALTHDNFNDINKVLNKATEYNNIDYIEYLLNEEFISKEDAARYLVNNK